MTEIERAVASYLGSSEVDWELLKPVTSFVVLWNRLEASHGQFLRLPQLLQSATDVAARPTFEICHYIQHLEYFRDRYAGGGQRLSELLKDQGEQEVRVLLDKLVRDELIANETKLKAVVLVPYRLRNNLFHGRKDTAKLYGQIELFTHANEVLCQFHIDLQGR